VSLLKKEGFENIEFRKVYVKTLNHTIFNDFLSSVDEQTRLFVEIIVTVLQLQEVSRIGERLNTKHQY
jgi:hypothetical protein